MIPGERNVPPAPPPAFAPPSWAPGGQASPAWAQPPATVAFFRCAYAIPPLLLLAWWEDRRFGPTPEFRAQANAHKELYAWAAADPAVHMSATK